MALLKACMGMLIGTALIHNIITAKNLTPHPIQQTYVPDSCIPRPAHIQAKTDAHTRPLIHMFDGWMQKQYFTDQSTSCNTCELTLDKHRYIEADAVVINYHHFHVDLPVKYCGQKHIFFSQETSHSWDLALSNAQRYQRFHPYFDYVSHYRPDSELPMTYMPAPEKIQAICSTQNPIVPTAERNSTFPVTWLASHCKTHNQREKYVQALMQHIGVANYGKCLHNADIPAQKSKSWRTVADQVVRTHKFYLAFENANCDYYVTEKLVRPLEHGLIPVVMGCPQARDYVPHARFALFVEDFASPEALARRMHEINQDDALFESFFQYRTVPSTIAPRFKELWMTPRKDPGCALCDLIRHPPVGRTGFRLERMLCEEKNGIWTDWMNQTKTQSFKTA